MKTGTIQSLAWTNLEGKGSKSMRMNRGPPVPKEIFLLRGGKEKKKEYRTGGSNL